jgi:DNA modification methylase
MLEFVRIKDPQVFKLIPRYLFEQIKDREYDIEQIYKFGPILILSRFNCLYLLVNEENLIKGILFATFDPLAEIILVYVLSVDKEYQRNGILPQTRDFLKNIKENDPDFKIMLKELGFDLKDKIIWQTTRPKSYEKKIGAKRSKYTIMET